MIDCGELPKRLYRLSPSRGRYWTQWRALPQLKTDILAVEPSVRLNGGVPLRLSSEERSETPPIFEQEQTHV